MHKNGILKYYSRHLSNDKKTNSKVQENLIYNFAGKISAYQRQQFHTLKPPEGVERRAQQTGQNSLTKGDIEEVEWKNKGRAYVEFMTLVIKDMNVANSRDERKVAANHPAGY